jgi:shikimate dehydrogenase
VFDHFAVIGNPIAHSLSPFIHHYFARQSQELLVYEKVLGDTQLFEQQVADFFREKGKGLNITLPFKQRAFALAQVATQRSQRAQAANTLWMHNNQIHADNTDGIGLIQDITRYLSLEGKNILIVGAGGAARGIILPLLELNPALVTVTNRTKDKLDALQFDFPAISVIPLAALSGCFDVVINATSVSLTHNTLELPVALMKQKPFCYDLAYALKKPTSFVHQAQTFDCHAVDGLGMLVEQAAESFYIWHGIKPSTEGLVDLLRNANRP